MTTGRANFIGILVLATAIAPASACRADREARETSTSSGSSTAEIPRHSRLTGCLQRGTIPGTFVLTEAEPSQIGTSGSRENLASTSYPLVNRGDTDLTNYVGSRVTVSGRFQAETDSPAADRAPGVADRTGAAPDVRELIVEEVERTDGACPAAER